MSDVLAQRLVDCRMSRVCNAAAEEGVGNASMIVSGFWFRKKVLIAGWLGDYNAQLKVVMGKCINDFVMVWLPGTETFSSWFSPQFHENQIDHWGWTMPTNCEVSPCLNSQPPGTPDVLSPYAAPWCCCCCSLGRKDSSPWIAVSISAPPPPPAEHVSSSRCAERWTKREWGRERKVSILAISCLSTLSSWKEL